MKDLWRQTLAVLIISLSMAGCTPDSPGDLPTLSTPASVGPSRPFTVAEAVNTEAKSAEVRGYILVGADQVMRLCAGLAGSFPPQCGQPAITVHGLQISEIPGRETDQGITWSGETTLHGALSGGVLTVA